MDTGKVNPASEPGMEAPPPYAPEYQTEYQMPGAVPVQQPAPIMQQPAPTAQTSTIQAPISVSANNQMIGPTTNIVVNAPSAPAAQVMTERGWSSGMCGCFDDCGSCCCGWLCPCCLICTISNDMGESCLFPYFVNNQIALAMLRIKMRTAYKIRGSALDDYFCSICCYQLTLCQLKREMKHVNY